MKAVEIEIVTKSSEKSGDRKGDEKQWKRRGRKVIKTEEIIN